MNYQPQSFFAPDGTKMVVLPAADFERLVSKPSNSDGVVEGEQALAEIDAGMGTMPDDVLKLILDEGLPPVAAWRQYRSLSQAELACKAGLSQVFVSKIERGVCHGTPRTRRALAGALGAPLWSLEEDFASSKRAQNELQSLIVAHVMERPGMTELDLAKVIKGRSGYQQQVNQECRALVVQGMLERRGQGGRGDPFRYHLID
jgi:transcriptional regulator with XRE-family HTH domain